MDEMRESFRKSQEFLGYETNRESEEEISRQRIVTPEEFEELITEGWQYLGTLPNGKIVIKNKQGSYWQLVRVLQDPSTFLIQFQTY